ncbi:DUF1266 domain-containing protein [Paenibacillus sp. A14]
MTYTLFNTGLSFNKGIDSYRHIQTCPSQAITDFMLLHGIKNEETFDHFLNWLHHKGYRHDFNNYARLLSTLSHPARQQYMETVGEEHKNKSRLYCVHTFMDVLAPSHIAAYDYALMVAIFRMGVRVKFMTRKSARSFSTQIAEVVQKMYVNWSEFHAACIAGAYFSASPADLAALTSKYSLDLLIATRHTPLIEWDFKLS